MKFDSKRGTILLAIVVVAGAVVVGLRGTERAQEAKTIPSAQAE